MLRPIPVVELDEKLINAKSHIGAVLQISCEDGSIVTDYRLYALLVNNMVCNTAWIIVGENNKDGIFHVHVIARTHVRTDSWRRTAEAVWKTIKDHPEVLRQWGGITLDCLKSQRAHKTCALLQYMMKDPIWIVSNSDPLLQMAYDIDKWELAARFKAPIDEKPDVDRANPMVAEILQCIMENNCKSLEDVIKHNPDCVIKYLHRPGFQSIVSNCLIFAKCTAGTWNIKNYAKYNPDPSSIHGCLIHQGILPSTFDPVFNQWINKLHGKKNTIVLLGPSNTGKSSFIAGLGKCCPRGEIVNGPTFNFEGLVDQYWGSWEEPLIPPEVVEKFKQVSEGMQCAIPIKFKKPYNLPRTPIFITTNQVPWYWCSNSEGPLRNRMWIFNFDHDASSGIFTPRCTERSCECRYCCLSRGRTPDTSSQTARGLPTKYQSVSESMVTGNGSGKSDVGSGSMQGRGGTSTTTTRTGGSGRESGSDHATRGSTSSADGRCQGSSTEHESSDTNERIRSTRTGSEQYMGTTDTEPSVRASTSGTRKSTEGRGDDTRIPRGDETRTTMVSMGRARVETTEMGIQIQTKKRRLGGEMVSMTRPDREEWACYLSYIYHRYTKKQQATTSEDILVCQESISASDSD